MVCFFKITAAVFKSLMVLTIIDSVFSESEVQKCIRYIKQLYKLNDPLEIYRKGFLSLNEKVIEESNARLAIAKEHTSDSDELNIIITKMNRYTKQYFYRVHSDVKIVGKESLLNSDTFCRIQFSGNPFHMIMCIEMIDKKFGSHTTGGAIFDNLYKNFTENDVKSILLFTAERNRLGNARRIISELPDPDTFVLVFREAIEMYYEQCKSILSSADVRGFVPPEKFCEDEVSESEDEFSDCKEDFGESSSF